MKCFNHPEKDAVAICKNCNKALCHDCISEMPNGVACKGSCEEEVIFIDKMIQRNKRLLNKTAHSYYRASFIYFAFGLVFGGFGFYTDIPPLKPFFLITGGVMLLGGLLTVFSGTKFKK